MGKRGPAPTPTAILAARGSWRGKLNKNEMRPEPGAPDPPEVLEGEALLEWHRVIAEIEPTRVLSKADRAALTLYCQTWAIAQDAARNIQATGTIIKLPNGYPGATPYLKVYNEATRICMRLLAEFGLTPSARARIPAGKADKDANGELDF
jgi:P27 family predicted phage terminase small subunit